MGEAISEFKNSHFQNEAESAKFFLWKWVLFAWDWIFFFFYIYGFIRTSPGFETKAWGYSEMAYSLSRLRLKRNNSVSITVIPSNNT